MQLFFCQNYSYRVPKPRTESLDLNSKEPTNQEDDEMNAPKSAGILPTVQIPSLKISSSNRKTLTSNSSQSCDDELAPEWTPEIPFENVSSNVIQVQNIQ